MTCLLHAFAMQSITTAALETRCAGEAGVRRRRSCRAFPTTANSGRATGPNRHCARRLPFSSPPELSASRRRGQSLLVQAYRPGKPALRKYTNARLLRVSACSAPSDSLRMVRASRDSGSSRPYCPGDLYRAAEQQQAKRSQNMRILPQSRWAMEVPGLRSRMEREGRGNA